ncbi:MAG TPA: DUF1501 domain-containing protein [Gemmataceae bacterium]|nr:DUF1501 domain-containing protein [Gemmataceae bacterium]
MAAGPLLSRRSFLYEATALAGLGALFRPAVAEELRKNQKRAILIWMSGGPSQLETWDPKPGTSSAGPHGTTATSIAGLHFDEYMPRLAHLANQMVVVRSVSSKIADHEQATTTGLTGSAPGNGRAAPLWLSICAKELIVDEAVWPSLVCLGQLEAATHGMPGGGFLGPRFDPLPCPGDGKPPEGLPTDAEIGAVRRRDALREKLGADFRYGHDERPLAAHDNAFHQVTGLLDRRGLFDASREPLKRVDRYGNTRLGRDCLLACRLVGHGVPFVLVAGRNLEWDLHREAADRQKKVTAAFDMAVGALVDDLMARGLWEHTLVVLMGEFGRTPYLAREKGSGRDHWARCWSMSFGGAAARGGVVVGKTTDDGKDIKERPVTVPDLLVTFYAALGLDPHKEVDVQGRPTPLVERGVGKVIREAL